MMLKKISLLSLLFFGVASLQASDTRSAGKAPEYPSYLRINTLEEAAKFIVMFNGKEEDLQTVRTIREFSLPTSNTTGAVFNGHVIQPRKKYTGLFTTEYMIEVGSLATRPRIEEEVREDIELKKRPANKIAESIANGFNRTYDFTEKYALEYPKTAIGLGIFAFYSVCYYKGYTKVPGVNHLNKLAKVNWSGIVKKLVTSKTVNVNVLAVK